MKKIAKVFLIVLILLGIAVSVTNFVASDLEANEPECGWVKYHPDEPDCSGTGYTCYDFTGC